ncbi:FAD-dependent monooxygenase [Actinoplanes sp. ATCC 53533]|uniref:FAD-dependent monooxygenase n=1 Tax=Actinoplanes sp. ATCC 53533 TaxID=1288362 RepID=UPI0018F4FB78|nr:FAD-dependent monooxygenase [Actinoplanes sp. ATCC 53533]
MLVVGAGPVGLTAALALRARGLPVDLLEADPEERARPGSRALFVHRQSLSTLDRIAPGLGERIGGYGVVWQTRRTFYRGRQVYTKKVHRNGAAGPPPFSSLRQADTERFLRAACVDAGVRFHWEAEVIGVESTATAVTVRVNDGRRFQASHLVAADGARSAVRGVLGIALAGARTEGSHVVVDIADREGARGPVERVFHYEHPGVGGRTVLRVPFRGGFQVDLQCRDDDSVEDFGTEAAVRDWLPGVIGDGYADRVLWISTYHFLQKVAESFTDEHRRVLLAGEAAHLFPPFGARGMNSGIADADAAAEAIAGAVRDPGEATGLVDAYAETRRAAAVFNSAAAGTALSHLRPRPLMRVKQRTAAALASVLPGCGSWLEHAPYGPRHGPPADPQRKY